MYIFSKNWPGQAKGVKICEPVAVLKTSLANDVNLQTDP